MPKLNPWSFVSREELVETRIFGLFRELWKSPRTGVEHPFSIVHSPDWVNVVALDRADNLLMIRQYRFGTQRFTLEVPGGMVDPDEDPRITAARELREETGYDAESFVELGSCEPNPAIFNNRCHMFLAEGCTPAGELLLDPGEDIEVVPMPIDEVMAMLEEGQIKHALVEVALSRFDLYRRGRLRLSASTRLNAANDGTKP